MFTCLCRAYIVHNVHIGASYIVNLYPKSSGLGRGAL